jgi:hypothetical protein
VTAELQLVRESESELFFRYKQFAGWAIAAIGWTACYFAWTKMVDAGFVRWAFTGVAGVFGVAGIAGAIWRYEITINLLSRIYSRRKGFWPAVKSQEGSLDELYGVALNTEVQGQDSKSSGYVVWVVRLAFQGEEKGTSVYESRNEGEAYRQFEHLAKALRLRAIDRTGDSEKITAPEDLDKPLVESIRDAGPAWKSNITVLPPVPPGSQIEVSGDPPNRTILLPAPRTRIVTIPLCLMGALFLGVAAFAVYAKLTGLPVRENRPGATWIVAGVFSLVGPGLIAMGLAFSNVREMTAEDAESVTFSVQLFGRPRRARRLLKSEIEEIALKPAAVTSQRRASLSFGPMSFGLPQRAAPVKEELVVRSRSDVARTGYNLSASELAWLRDAILSMVAGSSA